MSDDKAPRDLTVVTPRQRSGTGIYHDVIGLATAVQSAVQKANFLAPVTRIDFIPELYSVSLRLIKIDPNPANGDVYCPDTSKPNELALTLPALNRVAACGGVSWIPNASGRVFNAEDPRYKDPYFVHWRAVGIMRDFDGHERLISADKIIDMRDNGADYLRLGKDPNTKRVLQLRSDLYSLAESKARTRALRQAFGIKSKYSAEELKKPFCMPAMVLTGVTDDPELRRMYLAEVLRQARGPATRYYGAPAGQVEATHIPALEHQIADSEPFEPEDDALPPDDTVPPVPSAPPPPADEDMF